MMGHIYSMFVLQQADPLRTQSSGFIVWMWSQPEGLRSSRRESFLYYSAWAIFPQPVCRHPLSMAAWCHSHCNNTKTSVDVPSKGNVSGLCIQYNPVPWEWERDAASRCHTSPDFVLGQWLAVYYTTQTPAPTEGVPITSTHRRGVSFPFSGNQIIYITQRRFHIQRGYSQS